MAQASSGRSRERGGCAKSAVAAVARVRRVLTGRLVNEPADPGVHNWMPALWRALRSRITLAAPNGGVAGDARSHARTGTRQRSSHSLRTEHGTVRVGHQLRSDRPQEIAPSASRSMLSAPPRSEEDRGRSASFARRERVVGQSRAPSPGSSCRPSSRWDPPGVPTPTPWWVHGIPVQLRMVTGVLQRFRCCDIANSYCR